MENQDQYLESTTATKQGNNSIQFNRSDIQPASTLGLSKQTQQHQDQFEINAIDQAIQAASTLDSSGHFGRGRANRYML
jgi:hypothetical protein